MQITYSAHARRRMAERSISERDIEHVLSGRGHQHPSTRKRSLRGRTLGGTLVEVVYTEARAGQFHIVTVKIV